MNYFYQYLLNFLVILLSCVQIGWSEVCSSIVEDISVNLCNPNQRSSRNPLENPDSLSPKSCESFVDNISYKLMNAEHGIVSYHIVLPPATCGYTRYMFKLIASNASLCTHMDNIGSGRALKSVAAIHGDYADEFGVKNVRVAAQDNTSTTCSNDLVLTFEFVSTQCYQIVAQPFISSDSQIQLYSNWHSIVTHYKPIHPRLFVPQFDWRHDQNENLATIRVIVHSNLTTRPIASCVEIMSGVEATGQHACYESGSRMSQCLVWFGTTEEGYSSPHKCDKDRYSDSTLISKCASEMKNELVCWIENVTVGHYCVVMKFLDERCQGRESACSWHKMFTVNNNTLLSPSYSSLFPRSSSPSSSTLLIILSILVLLGVAALLILKTCHRRSLSMSHYKHFVLPISRTPSTVLEERQVLLLYARDCDAVMNVVKDFKSLLRRTGKCQVFDYWDVGEFNNVARNPLAWLNTHLANENTVVIIVTTPVAQLLLQSQNCHQAAAQPKNCIDKTSVYFSSKSSGHLSHGADGLTMELQDPGAGTRSEDTASLVSKKLGSHSDEQSTPLLSEESLVAAQLMLKVKYKESKCFDNLFVVALSSLAQQCTNYHTTRSRVYIVSFDADVQSLCSSFLLPITLTRFILPQHLENLLYHIHSLSPLSQQFALSGSDDYLKLTHSIDLMLTQRRTQPQYLLDLLVNVV